MDNIYNQHPYMMIAIAAIVAFVTTLVVVPQIISFSHKKSLLDKPDHRKQHKQPIPTMGGIGIFAGLALSSFVWMGSLSLEEAVSISISIIILLITGVLDDLKGLSAGKRLLIQVLAGVIVAHIGIILHIPAGFMGISHVSPVLEYCLTVFLIAGVTNSFNLIDGIDGLAGGIGFINAVIFGVLFVFLGFIPFALLAFSFAAALLAFLKYNFNPAKIFMGDTGSLVLGFLMVTFGIKIVCISATLPTANTLLLLVFSLLLLPVIDTARVFLFRALKQKSPFSADRSHIHHLLLKTGLDHRKAAALLYAANILLAIESFLLRNLRLEYAMCILVISAIVCIELLSIRRLLKMGKQMEFMDSDFKKMSTDNQLLIKYLDTKKK